MSSLTFKGLVDALKEPQLTIDWSLEDWQQAILIYRHCRLLASLKYRLEDNGVLATLPEPVIFHLNSAAVLAERQVQQVLFEVEELQTLFSELPQITPILLKGAAYITNKTRNSKGRICSDIDLLVERKFLDKAENVLLNSMWLHQEISDYDEKYYREFAHEIPPLIHLERSTVLDLHHNIYMSVSNRAPKIDVFLAHVQKSPVGLNTLTPPAAFVHSVIHLYLNEDIKFGFRDTYDQWLLCEEFANEEFWRDCIRISEECDFEFELMLAMAILQRFFAVVIPEEMQALFTRVSKTGRFKFWLAIYANAFKPEHELLSSKRSAVARTAVMLRGHWTKMPLPILIKHTSVKIYDFIFGLLAGERDKKNGQTTG